MCKRKLPEDSDFRVSDQVLVTEMDPRGRSIRQGLLESIFNFQPNPSNCLKNTYLFFLKIYWNETLGQFLAGLPCFLFTIHLFDFEFQKAKIDNCVCTLTHSASLLDN